MHSGQVAAFDLAHCYATSIAYTADAKLGRGRPETVQLCRALSLAQQQPANSAGDIMRHSWSRSLARHKLFALLRYFLRLIPSFFTTAAVLHLNQFKKTRLDGETGDHKQQEPVSTKPVSIKRHPYISATNDGAFCLFQPGASAAPCSRTRPAAPRPDRIMFCIENGHPCAA